MKQSIIFFMMLALLPFTLAEMTAGEEICHYIIDEWQITEGFTLPSFVPYSNGVFVGYTFDDDIIGHGVLESKVVSEIDCTEMESADYIIKVRNKQVLVDAFESDSWADAFNDLLSNDDVIIEAQSFGGSVAVLTTKIAIKIASWFS